MAKEKENEIEAFLSRSIIAGRAKVPARVVLRRDRLGAGELRTALDAGELKVGGAPLCDLIAGGTRVASGEIVERDGKFYFEAKESYQ